jgi:hypothetical protein
MRRLLGTALLLMLFSAGMWFAWLGWDHEYYLVDGVPQGPYRAWQVVGCGAAIATASVLAYLRVRDVIVIFVLAAAAVVGFAVPWSWDASSDETGMWVVGLFMLLIGGGAGLAMLLGATHALAQADASPTTALAVCAALTVLAVFVFPMAAVVPLVAALWVFFGRWLPERRALHH